MDLSDCDELSAALFPVLGEAGLSFLLASLRLAVTQRFIISSSFPSSLLHLLPMVHLRLIVLLSDCGNYLGPAAAMHYAQQTRKKASGWGGCRGQIAIRRPLDACWDALLRSSSRTADNSDS